MKKLLLMLSVSVLSAVMLFGCAPASQNTEMTTGADENIETSAMTGDSTLADGIYNAQFSTDSSMFHLNETQNGLGILSVKDGEMMIHITLSGTGFINLYEGYAEDAQKDGAVLLEPSLDTVDYGDGTTEEVYGYDIHVPYLDEEFNVAVVGKKGNWYDHKVSVSNPVEVN